MPDDLHDIRCGLAAQLRTVLDRHDGHVSPYLKDSPPLPALQVGTVESAERIGFGAGRRYVILVEGLFDLKTDVGSQKALDRLVAEAAVDEAVEADRTAEGALHNRLDEHNTLTTEAGPACQVASVSEYRGAARVSLPNGDRALQGVWAVEVLT